MVTSLRVSSPFGRVARIHTSAARERRRQLQGAGAGAGRGKKESALLLLPPLCPSWFRLSLAGSLAARKLDVHITELFVSTESLNFLFVLYAKVYRQFSLAVERKGCHVMSFFSLYTYRMG